MRAIRESRGRSALGQIGLALAIFTIGAICTLLAAGFFSVPIGTPPDAHHDTVFLLLIAKTALAGLNLNDVSFMAYPEGLSFARFPILDFTQIGLVHAISAFCDSPFQIWTAFHAASVFLGFSTCFILFLSLTGNPLQAAMLAFGCQFFSYIQRMTGHNFLFSAYSVALGCLLIIHIFAKEAIIHSSISWIRRIQDKVLPGLCLLVISLSGVYYIFFFLAIVGFLLAYSLLTGRYQVARAAVICGVLAFAVFICASVAYYPSSFFDAAINLPRRSMLEQPAAALRIADALLEYGKSKFNPNGLRSVDLIQDYANARDLVEGHDAFSGPFVSLMILAAAFFPLIMHTASPVQRWFDSDPQRAQLHRLMAASILFIILFATPYGYGMLFSGLITPSIRSQNRISVFMNIFGMILLLGLVRHLARQRTWLISTALAILLLLNSAQHFGYWRHYHKSVSTHAMQDMVSAQAVADLLPHRHDAAVLQLPYAPFPEVPPVERFAPYGHFLVPIMFRENDPEQMPRWSYGGMTGQISYEIGQSWIGHPLRPDWSSNARCLGYDHVIIQKDAYTTLPSPDPGIWQLVYEDKLRQLWRLAGDARSPAGCPTSYAADYRTPSDRRMLYGEDRLWHVDELGGFLRRKAATLAIPLPGARGRDTCVRLHATLLNRPKTPKHNDRVFLSVADQEIGYQVAGSSLNIDLDIKVPAASWEGSHFFLRLSQFGRDMTLPERVEAWHRSRSATLGIRTLQAQVIDCKG